MVRATRIALLFGLVIGAGYIPRVSAGNDSSDTPKKEPDFALRTRVFLSVPDKAIEESFQIATDLVVDMRRLAYRHYKYDGWMATSDGRNGKRHLYDIRDFRYGPKCAAYLWGDDALIREMGKRIFFDQHDKDGKLTWDTKDQCAIHIAHVAKHFSDYMRHSEQDAFIRENWDRQLKILKWSLSKYDRNGDGLLEQGEQVPTRIWGLLVGEPYNGFTWDKTQNDVVVVASMEVSEWLQLLAAYGEANNLPETVWLKSKAEKTCNAIEAHAYDMDANYYYLLYRAGEKKWYHSGRGMDESSREFDVTPYYAALIAGNDERGRKVAEHARHVLMDLQIFPMPLIYPSYHFAYKSGDGFVPGGCSEESYYNCVRAWAKYGMFDAVFAAIKRRSEAHVRDQDCLEWYMKDGSRRGPRDRYGISAAAHVSAIIEGLFGITPRLFGFDEVNIWPAIPAAWEGKPASIGVALPGGGFLKYTYLLDKEAQAITLRIETDKQRQGHFRIPIPRHAKRIAWNGESLTYDIAAQAEGRGESVSFAKPFERAAIAINLK